jgi:IS5 family transposase
MGQTTVKVIYISTVSGNVFCKKLLGDKACDSNSFRKSLRDDGITPVIPARANRRKRIRHDKTAYNGRNVIERCTRIATRYDACVLSPP